MSTATLEWFRTGLYKRTVVRWGVTRRVEVVTPKGGRTARLGDLTVFPGERWAVCRYKGAWR